MNTNGNDIELIPFITFIKLARWQKGTNAQLRHELEKVTAERNEIADTCKHAHELCVKWQEETQKVAAERDALQQRLDSISKLPVIDLSQHRRTSRTGSLSRDII